MGSSQKARQRILDPPFGGSSPPSPAKEMNEITIFSGSSNLSLAEKISSYSKIPLGDIELSSFADGETYVQVKENVRGKDVFFIQSTSKYANFHIMETLLVTDALRRASAKRINLVIPYFGYARQDRKDRPRVPISARVVADLIEKMGASRVITVDLHAGQIQGFFSLPVDHLTALPLFVDYFRAMDHVMVISPDAGGAQRAMDMADKLGVSFAILFKRRRRPNEAEIIQVVGDVDGKKVIIVDDIVDTAGTLIKASEAIVKAGASEVYAAITHPVLSGPAIDRIRDSKIKEVVVTNTIEISHKAKECDKIKVLDISHLIGEAIIRVHEESSISELFR